MFEASPHPYPARLENGFGDSFEGECVSLFGARLRRVPSTSPDILRSVRGFLSEGTLPSEASHLRAAAESASTQPSMSSGWRKFSFGLPSTAPTMLGTAVLPRVMGIGAPLQDAPAMPAAEVRMKLKAAASGRGRGTRRRVDRSAGGRIRMNFVTCPKAEPR